MGTRAVFVLCLLAVSAFVSALDEETASAESLVSDVLVLDISNFTENVEKYDFLVVEFYAPWCGHCKRLAPEYETAATTLKSHDPPIYLAKVDVNEEENKPLASEFDVRGFPSLKVIRNKGQLVQEYKGPREADGIISYLKKLSGPPSLELISAGQAEEFLSEHEKELTIIGVFKVLDGEEFANFIKVAEALRSDYYFAHTLDSSYVPDNGVPLKIPSVRLHKDFDDKIVDHDNFSVEALSEFLETESLPLVTEMNKEPENRPALLKFFESKKDKVFLFLRSPEGKEEEGAAPVDDSEAILSSFTNDAKLFKEKGLIFLFAYSAENSNALQYFGVAESALPAYAIQNNEGKNYILSNVDSEQLAPWLNDFLEGKLKAHIKSEPIPLTNDEPVKVVVADSIKELVLDSGKDVFLEFYAPWCGHCKKLAPILEEVAVSFESDADVVIAKFDATANDAPKDLFEVKGFPSLYFYSAAGVITSYEGDRTTESIIGFINENRSKSVKPEEAETIPEVSQESVTEPPASKDEL